MIEMSTDDHPTEELDRLLDQVAASPNERYHVLQRLLGDAACRQLGIFRVPTGFKISVVIPVFKVLLTVLQLPRSFSPVDSLSTGRDISWTELAQAFGAVVLLLGGRLR